MLVVCCQKCYTVWMDTIDAVLGSLGLGKNEVRVYKALVAGDAMTVSAVAKETGLPASTTKFTLQQLVRRGVVSMVRRKNAHIYSVEDSRRLLTVIELQKQSLEQKHAAVLRILESLESLRRRDASVQRVRFFEGQEGVLQAWMLMLQKTPSAGVLRSFAHPVAEQSAGYPTLARFVNMRMRKQVRALVLATDSSSSAAMQAADAKALRETRIMRGYQGGSYSSEIMIGADAVCLSTVHDGQAHCTLIESAPVAQLLQLMFNGFWQAF